eukprot:scaffold209799_cov17-Tisochrysis_lutea.AAC.1
MDCSIKPVKDSAQPGQEIGSFSPAHCVDERNAAWAYFINYLVCFTQQLPEAKLHFRSLGRKGKCRVAVLAFKGNFDYSQQLQTARAALLAQAAIMIIQAACWFREVPPIIWASHADQSGSRHGSVIHTDGIDGCSKSFSTENVHSYE